MVLNAIGLAIIMVFLMVDYLFSRMVVRALVWAVDRLPPYRPGGRYKSQSSPEKYVPFRKRHNGT